MEKKLGIKKKFLSAISVILTFSVLLMCLEPSLLAKADSPWTGTWNQSSPLITGVQLFDLTKGSTHVAGYTVPSTMTLVNDVVKQDGTTIPGGAVYQSGDVLPALSSGSYLLAPVITSATTGIGKTGNVRVLYSFAIPDGYNVDSSTTYQFTLPKEVALQSTVTNMTLSAPGIAGAVANVSIPANPTGSSTGTITFTTASNGYMGRHGAFYVDTQFANMGSENTTPVEIPFAVQGESTPLTITVYFQQPAPILSKSGAFDSPSSNVNWTVTVNANQTTMNNSYLTDVVPAGLSYVPGTFTVKDNTTNTQVYKDGSSVAGQNISDAAFTYTQSTATLRYDLPATTSDQYTVTYATNVPSSQYGIQSSNTANLYYNGIPTPIQATYSITPSPSYITKSGAASVAGGKQQITWTIPFNNDGGTMHSVTITDPYSGGAAAPAGSTIVSGSVQYYPQASPGSVVTLSTVDTSTPYYSDDGSKLTVHFGDITGAQTLVFTVQFPDNYLQVNQSSSYTNTATLTASDNTYLSGGVPAHNTSGVGVSNNMLRKTGTPDYTTGQIDWTVTLNTSRRLMTNPQLQDTIGAHQTYVPGTFIVKDSTTSAQIYKESTGSGSGVDITNSGFSYMQSASPKALQYTFSADGITNTSDTYIITYSTQLDSDQNQTYAGNSGATYGNTAKLLTDTTNSSVYSSTSPTVTYQATMLSKTGGGFNYSTHELTWKIDVNTSQYPLNNVMVTDFLTDNSMKWQNGDGSNPTYAFDFDGTQPVQVKVGSADPVSLLADSTGTPGVGKYYYDSSARKLTFNLGDIGSTTQSITFQMKLVEPVDSYFKLNSSPTIHNTASMTSNENNNPTTASGNQLINNTMVGKTAVYTTNNKYIDWNVQIDQNSADIGSAVKIADTLQSGLLLDTSSVKLYTQTQNAATGILTPNGTSRNTDGSPVGAGAPLSLSTAQIVYEVSTNNFTFTMPTSLGTINAPYLLTFRTYIDTSIITNSSPTVNNTVTLSGQTAQTQTSGNASATYHQTVGGYVTGVTGQITLKKADAATGGGVNGAKFSLYDQYGNHLRDVTTATNGTVVLPYLVFSVPYRLVEATPPTGYLNDNTGDYWFEYLNVDGTNGRVQQITSATDTTPIGSPTASSSSPQLTFSDRIKTASIQFTKIGDGGTGLAGAKFTLTGTALNGSTVNLTGSVTDTSGQVAFANVPYSNASGYTLTETVVPTGYFAITPMNIKLNDSTVSGGFYTALSSYATTVTDIPAGTLTVTKMDADTGDTLSGATFTLTKQNSPGAGTVYSLSSASGGSYVFTGIPMGTYVLNETAAPADYAVATSAQGNGQVITFAAGSLPLRLLLAAVAECKSVGSVTFTKTDGTTPLAGAQFGLFHDQAGTSPVAVVGDASQTVVSNATTTGNGNPGDDGKVTFGNVPYGDGYWVVETKTPVNHNTAAPFQISLHQPSLTVPAAHNPVVNLLKTGTIQFIKTDGFAPLPGAQFTLSGNGITPQTVTSAGNGLVKFVNVPYSSTPYTVTENSSPDAAVYLLAQPFTVTLNDAVEKAPNSANPAFSHASFTAASGSDPNTLTIDDVADTPLGSITVTKVDAANTGTTLANAQFSVHDAYNGTDYTLSTSTDASGNLTFHNLPLDPNPSHATVFTLTETTAPGNYELNPQPITVTLYNRAGMRDSVANNLFGDSKKVATVRLHKQDQAGKPLQGAEFALYETVSGKSLMVSAPGLTNPVKSDKNGLVQFVNVPYGSYFIQETAAPADYIGDTVKIAVSLSDQDEKTPSNPTGTIINGSAPSHMLDVGAATNTLRKGTIQFVKRGENGPLCGAVFTLYNAGGTSAVKDADGNLFTAVSADTTGLVKLTDVPYGDYTLVETAAPVNYNTAAPVRVSLHDSTADASGVLSAQDISDTLQRSTIIIHTTDPHGDPVPGDKLQLINDDGVPLGATVTTDANGNATFPDIPNGNYQIKNLTSGGTMPVSVILDGKIPLVSATMYTPVSNPKTGDSHTSSHMVLYTLLSGGSVAIILRKRKSYGKRQAQKQK